MSRVAAQSPSDDLASLDAFLRSDTLWRERANQAQALADHLLTTRTPIVVMHGPSQTGRTELIQRWLMPMLMRTVTVSYRSGTETPDEAAVREPAAIQLWDNFERVLGERVAVTDAVVQELGRVVQSGGRTRAVLIIREDHLSRLFQLGAIVPRALDDIIEISPGDSNRLVEELPELVAPCGLTIAPETADLLTKELAEFRPGLPVHPEVVGMVAFELCRLRPADGVVLPDFFVGNGRLLGLLETHLDYVLQNAPDHPDLQIGWAVLEEVAKGQRGQPMDLEGIPARFECDREAPAALLYWLEHSRRILRKSASRKHKIVHPELLAAIEARMQRETVAYTWLRWNLRQGVRHFAETEALPSEPNFRRAHANRAAVSFADDEARLMLRCALVYEQPGLEGATAHWLRRIKQADAAVDVLLGALFSSRADVRRRAARALAAYRRAEVLTQLHLLALRDPDETVRRQAVDSLAAFKDDALRDSFIAEIREDHTPYKLQAIDALRLFDDAVTVQTLVDIVGAGESVDRVARQRAIAVLALQQTGAAADALLQIAIDSRNDADREDAARALGTLNDPRTIRFVLERLRAHTPARGGWSIPRPRAVVRSLGAGMVATVVVLATLALHGLALATLRRWWLAAGVTAIQAAGVASFMAGPTGLVLPGFLLYAISFSAGVVLPLRTVLHDRKAGVRGSYRPALAIVLFLVAAVTIFLFLHGLASMIVHNVRRSLALTGCQVAGLILLVPGFYVVDAFSAFSGAAQFSLVQWSFAGLLVLALSYVAGLFAFVLELARTRHLRARQRLMAVHQRLVKNPEVARILLDEIATGQRGRCSHVHAIVRTFGEPLDGALRSAWDTSDEAGRRRLYALALHRRDPGALGFLKRAAGSLGWKAKVRYAWTSTAIKLSLSPAILIGMLLLAATVAMAVGGAFYARYTYDPARLTAQFRDPDTGPTERRRIVEILQILASQQSNPEIAGRAAAALTDAMATAVATDNLNLRMAIVEAIARASINFQRLPVSDFVDVVATQLDSTDSLSAAIDALGQIDTAKAAAKLREFVEREAPLQVKDLSSTRRVNVLEAKRRAIGSLAQMQNAGAESIRALDAIASNVRLAGVLKTAAGAALRSADPLRVAEYYAAESDLGAPRHDDAIRLAGTALSSTDGNVDRVLRAREVLRQGYTHKLRAALTGGQGAPDYRTARGALFEALAYMNSRDASDELIELGLTVSYGLHEVVALEDAAAYEDAYKVLSELAAKSGESPLRVSVQANLVESSLTTGRYDEAYRRASEVMARPDNRGSVALMLNMHFFRAAALALKSDDAGATRAFDAFARFMLTLPPGFTDDWVYGGTRHYIQQANVPEQGKQRLLEALTRVELARVPAES